MRKIIFTTLLGLIYIASSAQAQTHQVNDSTVADRTVVVEREYQPTIQSAGKLQVKPYSFDPQHQQQTPEYSTYSQALTNDFTLSRLAFSPLYFRQREPLFGQLTAGVGHQNTLLNFGYLLTDHQLQPKRKNARTTGDFSMLVYADHQAQWGLKALSESQIGVDIRKQFQPLELYFNANGANDFFTRYGAYFTAVDSSLYEVNRLMNVDSTMRQVIWKANAHVGVKGTMKSPIHYQLETGYEAFIAPDYAAEHQIHTKGIFDYEIRNHHAGLNLDIQNRLYTVNDASIETSTNHSLHFEPYYQYDGERWMVHAGVNADFSIGRGRLAGISPNVYAEAQLTHKNWLAIYGSAVGNYSSGGAQGEYEENRYRALGCLFTDTLSGEYTPIDASLGLKIRPYKTLLIDLYARYALTLDHHVNVFGRERYGLFEHELKNVQIARFGADLHYHYRDVLLVSAGGHYALRMPVKDSKIGDLEGVIFDEPSWEAHLRIEGKIDEKWSLYSDNRFAGKRHACVYELQTNNYESYELRPMFNLNLGAQYSIDKWLSVFVQLNNYLAWTPKLSYFTYYGYEAQRANCLMGVKWLF